MGKRADTKPINRKSKESNNIFQAIYKHLSGSVTIRGRRLPKAMLVGILGVVFMYVGVAGIVSTTTPWWLGRGDAPRHLDYIWSVYNGNFPSYNDGFSYPAFSELGRGVYTGQPAAGNPPLFYLIHAPFVGPLLEKGEWHKAIAVGRSINILLGILCILALAWAGWLMGGRRKAAFAVAVPALGVMLFDFTILNVNFAIDVLLILLSTLALITTYKILKNGLKLKFLIALSALSILGMATKISYAVFLWASLFGVVLASYIRREEAGTSKNRNIIKAFAIALGIFLLVIFTIGWFYYFEDYRVSGSILNGRPPGHYISHRANKTLVDVLGGGDLWSLLYSRFSSINTISVSLISFSVSGILMFFNKEKIKRLFSDKLTSANLLILIFSFLGIFATQIVHADGTGGYYFRYLLPALLPMGLFLAFGLMEFKWTRGMVVWFFSVLLGGSTIYKSTHLDTPEFIVPGLNSVYVSIRNIGPVLFKNGIPREVGFCLLALFFTGAILLAYGLINVNRLKKTEFS